LLVSTLLYLGGLYQVQLQLCPSVLALQKCLEAGHLFEVEMTMSIAVIKSLLLSV
jgi:hypothetical protein